MTIRIFDRMEECTQEEINRLLECASSQRREQALRFKHTFGQFACLKSYEMLQEILQDYGINEKNLEFFYNENGKPFLMSYPSIFFNISHCKKAIAVAVDTQNIGIDIESVRNENQSLVEYTMNDAEIANIQSADSQSFAFLNWWTRKEAYLKFLGTGLSNNLKNVLENCEQVDFSTYENVDKGYVYTICIHK